LYIWALIGSNCMRSFYHYAYTQQTNVRELITLNSFTYILCFLYILNILLDSHSAVLVCFCRFRVNWRLPCGAEIYFDLLEKLLSILAKIKLQIYNLNARQTYKLFIIYWRFWVWKITLSHDSAVSSLRPDSSGGGLGVRSCEHQGGSWSH